MNHRVGKYEDLFVTHYQGLFVRIQQLKSRQTAI